MKDRGFLTWVILGVVLVVLLNLPASISGRAKAAVREGLSPLQHALSGALVRLREAVSVLRGLGGILRENQEMKAELIRLRNRMRELKELERENIELREQLQFLRSAERQLVPCEVIARDISGWWQTVRLSRGRADGIEPGRAVVTPEGLVGRTMDVSEHTCDVLLISDPSCRVSARIARTGTFGVVTGAGVSWTGRAVCRMDFLNKNEPVQPGDEVVTSGLGGVFPKNLLVGYVERVHRDAAGLYQYADVLPKADLGALTYVFVVLEEEDLLAKAWRERRGGAQEGP